MATIRTSVEAQSKALSDAAGEILAQPKVAERRYVPLSAADAVLRYASDFIPSWAGAIAIDLLPAVLVGVMAVAHGAARRDEETLGGRRSRHRSRFIPCARTQRGDAGETWCRYGCTASDR